jgi:hypothetical protein
MVEVSIASLFDEAALTVSSADSDRPATTARIALWEYAGEWKPAVLDALRPDGANRLAFSLQDRLCAVTVAGVRAAPFVTLLPPGEGHLAFDEPALDDPAPAVRIGLRDASAEAILRYLEAGATQDARLIAESAAASFQSADQVDVAAAMIGAYCLLRTGGHAHLKDWPEAAVTQYPWLPDTHVIFAAQMLRESGVPRFGRALQELLDAADAGIPIHSDGLRRLYDGLIAFRNTPEASDSSSSITKVIDRLTPYVAAMNRDRIYTSYYGSWPGAPAIVPDHDVGELELTNVDELTSG